MVSEPLITEGKQDDQEPLAFGQSAPSPFEAALKQSATEAEVKKEPTEEVKPVKELVQTRNPETGLITFNFAGGGEIPQALSGSYTSKRIASLAEEAYLAGRRQRRA